MGSNKETIESVLDQENIKISLRCPRERELPPDRDHQSAAVSSNAHHALEVDSDVQSVLKNMNFFNLLFTRHPLSAVKDINDFYYFLLLRKISKIQELVRNKNICQLLKGIADQAASVYKQWKGPAIKYINGHKEEIFSKSKTDSDLKYAALDFAVEFQSGIFQDVFEYLCQECSSMIIERFDDLEGIFKKSAKAGASDANKDLFIILFPCGHHLPCDCPSGPKLIRSMWLPAVLNIWKREYSKNNGHRLFIEHYIADIFLDAESLFYKLSKFNVYERETALKALSSFLNEIKNYKSDVLSEYVTEVEKLKRRLLDAKADIVQKIIVDLGAEYWRCTQGRKSRLYMLTHYDNNRSHLSKGMESPHDQTWADMPEEEFFCLDYRETLSNLEGGQAAQFLAILRDQPAFDNYSRLVKEAVKYISCKMSKQEAGLAEDINMMLAMLSLAYRNINKTSQEQEIFCYSLSIFLCSLSEKVLRLFNYYLTKDPDSENATLGDLLNVNKKELADALGIDHIRTLAYFLTGTPGIKLGRNYRNSLVHWSAGMVPGEMTPIFASSMLWLFTDILNSVSIYFDSQSN